MLDRDSDSFYAPDIKADSRDRLVPQDFVNVVVHRYLPVLSLTYIASVIGIAIKKTDAEGGLMHFLLQDPYAYRMALWVGLFVSVPAFLWIFFNSAVHIRRMADIWYKASVGIMVAGLLLSMLLFPISETGFGVRMFMVASIPVFLVQFMLFIKGGLPLAASLPLSIAGVTVFVYGLIL